jgi:FkbM family methyltransferase
MRSYGLKRVVDQLFSSARMSFMKVLNIIPYLRLELVGSMDSNIYFPPDGFGALEENLLTGKNIYFEAPSIRDADTIIDLGAHAGSFTTFAILHSRPRARIVAVEPNEKNFRLLSINIEMLKDVIKEKELCVHALRKAVWIKRGPLSFVDTGWSEGGHISDAMHQRDATTRANAITLDDVLDLGRGKVVVKMDIEGAEVPVLALSKSLGKVTRLAVEAHGNEAVLFRLLKLRGYEPKVVVYRLNPTLSKYWLAVKPRVYGLTIAAYRSLVTCAFKPKITLIKASKPCDERAQIDV